MLPLRKGCCLPYKGTNFSANHNSLGYNFTFDKDVVYPTKVRIFQQITTMTNLLKIMVQMLFTLQRYEFFSKSQQSRNEQNTTFRCCLPYKGTNFSANHNKTCCSLFTSKMLFTLQRYEFFSKSQLCSLHKIIILRCCLPYKGTNFSANHNYTWVW